jgi:hypothetical protein
MSGCEHKISGNTQKVWMPYYFEGRERGLKPHPYCIECGLIKNLSSEKPRSIGYFMNIIAELGVRYKIAKIQTRLIALDIERLALDDKFGMDRKQQEELFVEITTRILNVPARAVVELLT